MFLDEDRYERALEQRRLELNVRFEPHLHPRDLTGRWRDKPDLAPKPASMRITGWHGLTHGEFKGEPRVPLYIALDIPLAVAYGGGPEGLPGEPITTDLTGFEDKVAKVSYDAQNPMVLRTGQEVKRAWEQSGLMKALATQRFHPDTTNAFVEWAKSLGHDAVVIAPSAFEGEDGFEWSGGTWGEPQAILFDSKKIKLG